MKTFGYIVLGILVLLIAVVVIVPFVFDLNDYKDEISTAVKEATGRELAIDGDIDLSLLPVPTIKVNGVRFANLDGAATADMVRIGVIEASVAIAPLFSGNIEVGSLTFVEPIIELEVLADGRANWQLAIAGGGAEQSGGGGAPPVRIDSLVVENATVVFRDSAQGTVERIEKLTFEAAVGSVNGPFSAEGSLVARGLPLAFAVDVGGLDRRPVSLRLSLALSGTGATLGFNGAASSASADAELTGKLTIAGDSLARVIAAVGGGGVDNPLLAHKFSLKASVAASAAAAGINDITFELGGVQGTGAVSVLLAEGPQIDAAIALNHVDLDQLLAASGTAAPGEDSAAAGPAEPFALPQGIFATLDLRVNAVVFNQAVVRQVQLVAALDQGVLTLQQASALLPGGSDITVFGVLDAQDGKPHFTGQIEASADNLRAVFDWLDIAPSGVPADRLRKLSLSSAVEITPGLVKVSAIDLRVDSSRLTGGVNIGLGARPAFNAIVALDRINLDAYLPPAGADAEPDAAAQGDPLAVLGAFDAELKAQVGKLVYNAVPVSGVTLDAGLRNGVLTLRSLKVADLAGARVVLAGRIDSAKPEFDVSYDIQADDAARLFQLAEVTLPGGNLGGAIVRGKAKGDFTAITLDTTVVLSDAEASFAGALTGLAGTPSVDARISLRADSMARLAGRFGVTLPLKANTPVTLEGEVKGDASAVTVALAASVFGADARIDGRLTNLMDAPAYDLALALDHADFAAFAASLADGVTFARRDLGKVKLRARIAGDAVQARITDLQAVLGPTQFSGTIAVRFDGPRPSLEADITAGEIYVDLLQPARAADGAGGTGASASAGGGAPGERWSRQPIDLSGLRAADARVRITAKALNFRNYRFEDVSLRLTLADGALDLEDLSGRLYGAPAKLRARLADTAPPTASLALTLQGADLKALLVDSAGVDVASGRLDLTGQFQTRGRSEFELVSALGGQAKFEVRQGAVEGIDLGRLNSQLANIDNEIALISLLGTALTGGTTPIHSLEGTFVAENGVLRSNDLHAVLEGGEGRATATVDLPRWQLAMNSEFRLTGHPNAPPIGLLLMGPIDDPRREIRDEALRAHIMEKVIGAVVRKLAPGVTDELGAGGALLEGILGGGQTQQQAPAEEAPAQEAPPAEEEPLQTFENLLEGLIFGN